jgi:hypothetical protein
MAWVPIRVPHRPSLVRSAAVLAVAGFLWWGCTPERLRPGPPSLVIEGPEGSTVFSPDTVGISVFARDDNGLDSVTVTILGRTEELGAFDQVEVSDIFLWPIPEGLSPGELVEIVGLAKDLVGERTVVTTSVTVVARPPAGIAR